MSYNIMSKNASFKGDISGTIENQVNDWDNQTVGGTKTFSEEIQADAGIDFGSSIISGSGAVSASFFHGDGTGLTNTGTITSYSNHATDRLIAGGASASAIKALSDVTFTAGKLGVAGQISASLGVTGSTLHGAGGAITALDAGNISAGSLSAARLNLDSAGGLEANSDSLRINLSSSTSGLFLDSDGLAVNPSRLTITTAYADTTTIIVQGASDSIASKMAFSTLEANMTIAAPNLTGEINNDRFPDTIDVPKLSGSTHISGAFFFGNGAGLTGVTSTPSPAGSNTQIQFNADGVLSAEARLSFVTSSYTLETTNISASVNISGSSLYLQDEIYVGGQAFLDIETNVAANNASFTEVTASSTISSSADVYGANFRGNGSTLNNVPLGSSNAASIVFVDNSTNKTITTNSAFTFNGTDAINTGGGFKGTILSASADVQVGGHITGSGNIVLTGSTNSIIFDMALNDGPNITSANENELTIDGDNTVKIQSDSYVVIRQNTTAKHTYDFGSNYITSSMTLSSSAAVSASIVDSLTGYNLGGQTVMDVDANITCGNITIPDGSTAKIDFGDNYITGSGFVSASAFIGDGSQLTNLNATPTYRYYNLNGWMSLTTAGQWIYLGDAGSNANPAAVIHNKWTAPGSGSIVRWVVNPITTNANSDNGGYLQTSFLKNNIAVNPASSDERTASVTGSFNLARVIGSTDVSGSIVDWTGTNLTVSGSNTFDPGDILMFAIEAENQHDNVSVDIIIKIDESIIY